MTKALAARLRELIDTKGFDAALPTINANLRSILTALERVEEMREALERIASGDAPRPVAVPYDAAIGKSKMDKCAHDRRMYEDCDTCVSDFARAALRSTP